MNHNQVHVAVEIVDHTATATGKVVDTLDTSNKVAKGISAYQAFRDYNWLKGVPATNVAGDLRGMVVSAKWNAAFQFTVKAGDVLGKVSAFATLAVGVAESYGEIDAIVRSNDPWNIKSAQLSTQITGIAMKYLTGIVTAPTHAVLMSMPVQAICSQIDQSRGNRVGNTGGCQWTLKALDTVIQSAAHQVSDGNDIYLFVNTTINPSVSRMLGY